MKGAVKKQVGMGSHRRESWWAEDPEGQGQRPGRHRVLLRGTACLRANCRGHSTFLLDPVAVLSRSEAQISKPVWHRVPRQSSKPAWLHTLPIRCVMLDKYHIAQDKNCTYTRGGMKIRGADCHKVLKAGPGSLQALTQEFSAPEHF